jgi:hypothetical protein
LHQGHLPVASGTFCSTLYLSDERRSANPTRCVNFAEATFVFR